MDHQNCKHYWEGTFWAKILGDLVNFLYDAENFLFVSFFSQVASIFHLERDFFWAYLKWSQWLREPSLAWANLLQGNTNECEDFLWKWTCFPSNNFSLNFWSTEVSAVLIDYFALFEIDYHEIIELFFFSYYFIFASHKHSSIVSCM